MAGMLIGATGYGREAVHGASDDWSATVEELLTTTASQTFYHKASLGPGVGCKRGMTALISVRSGVPDVVTIALDPPPDREPPA